MSSRRQIAAVAVLTALALYPWTVVVSGLAETDNPFTWPVVAGWVFAAAMVTRVLYRRPRLVVTHALVHLASAAAAFAAWTAHRRGIPFGWEAAARWRELLPGGGAQSTGSDVFALFWWAALWYWGFHLAARGEGRERVADGAGIGLVGWGLCLLLLRSAEMPTAPLLPALFAYFLVGLAAQGLSREAGPSATADPAATVPLVGLLAVTAAASYGVLGLAGATSAGIRTGVDGAVGFFGPRIVAFLQWLFGRPRSGAAPEADPGPMPVAPGEMVQVAEAGPTPWWLKLIMAVAGAVFAVLALIALGWALWRLWLYLTERRGGVAPGVDDGGAGWLALWWKALLERGRLWWQAARRMAFRFWGTVRFVAGIWFPKDVYSLYRGYLWWGRLVGWPRHPSETPGEYRRRVGEAVPAAADIARDLTDALSVALYAPGGEGEALSDAPSWPALRRKYRRLFHPRFLAEGWRARFRRSRATVR